MKHTTAVITATTVFALSAALAGCTSSATGGNAQAETKEVSSYVPERQTVECVDGLAQAEASNAILTVEKDCARLEITGVNSLIVAEGEVETLVVDGSINRVEAQSVSTIEFVETSSGNQVVTSADADVVDNGKQNEVLPEDK
ncbi:hypothetical protein [Leucobacter aridicollis]|uniref:DUF3060 domain-containing protein n=1 Tax=Leucobacter aridicollis TaxID=283878 RepID=A0A852R0L0_9MICO|nr:hypothetical protein [Leucobacter aridicollis]MBL3683488.1 hypothetical protein [Leucobacter aridicollis]NYD25205.1 hypothetical protein [Leucobacter aridicollis]